MVQVRNLAPEITRALIGYGSWYARGLRKPQSFPDVYLIVDSCSRFHRSAFHAWMNRLLPPNVYFIWSEGEGRRQVRGKYNVIGAAELERECGPELRDLYNAGRLTKLIWLAWTRDEEIRDWLLDQLVRAHCTLTPLALALLPERFEVDAFSLELLGLSYRGEPRLEGWEKVRQLHAAYEEHYRALHGTLLESYGRATGLVTAVGTGFEKDRSPAASSEWARISRIGRRLVRRSRLRGYLRWPRIVLTEPNLLDLAVNEAERKAGVTIRVTPRLRRHPLLYGLPEFLRVLRERRERERIDRWR